MSELPLTLSLVLRRASRMGGSKWVVTALREGAERRTWAQVAERALRLCGALKRLGVRPGERVATFGWNHHQHLELLLGVPQLGACVHPINVRLHPDDVVHVSREAEDAVVFVDASLTPLLAEVRARLPHVRHWVVMGEEGEVAPSFMGAPRYEELIAGEAPLEGLSEVDERTPASLCYTSGTTGRPQGVEYSHRALVLHAMGALMVDSMAVSERDVVLPLAPFFHASGWGLPYSTAFAGATLVLPGPRLDAGSVAHLIERERVTLAAAVPTVWNAFEPVLREGKHELSSLRRILCGGAPLPMRTIQRFAEHGISFLHAWGMTELAPSGTMARAREEGSPEERLAPLALQGAAVPGIELRVVDSEGRELPWDGASVGELEARGLWGASRYFKGSEGERFRAGWLRTGDVATLDAQGALRIVDRTKDLVKSGGEWISSVELENHLMAHPGVKEVAVIAVPHEHWGERPVAVVVRQPESRVSFEELVEHLRPRVARWWLPDAAHFVAELPKTATGKVDKKALRRVYARSHAT
ncbi:long-chain fatty acid--CoA ligase [Hyalangium versicolor]|uniref:long-chain fatty acid--CoA ligase n=1 Tax=Hyalangium versicolor TaxID=2861190 RepID=UPI001CCCC0A8|nr:long-chain fatty acid--CoA ligase [Hyalangium versicolor]